MSKPHTSAVLSCTACTYTVADEGIRMASLVSRLPRAWRIDGMMPEVSRPTQLRCNNEHEVVGNSTSNQMAAVGGGSWKAAVRKEQCLEWLRCLAGRAAASSTSAPARPVSAGVRSAPCHSVLRAMRPLWSHSGQRGSSSLIERSWVRAASTHPRRICWRPAGCSTPARPPSALDPWGACTPP